MTDGTIYTFWEPRGAMLPYLQLCLETWHRALSGYDIVLLDHTSLEAYLGASMFDPAQLQRLSLPQQKDAIMVAVLQERGGIFMDVDTLVVSDLAPLLRPLKTTEMVMIGSHMAFAAARPGARLLARWHGAIQDRLDHLDKRGGQPVAWDYVGNSVLTEMMDGMVGNLPGLAWMKRQVDKGERRRAPLGLLGATVWARKMRLFHAFYRRRLTRLSRDQVGYLPEVLYYGDGRMSAEERYRRFWFEDRLPIDRVFESKPIIIGLHNSWTPEWYQALTAQEVLAGDCLLSGTLKYLLSY